MGKHHQFSKKLCDNTTKYVKGGLCKPGNGSKCKPWNSLALAEADTTWKTLVVLASMDQLNGGINMRPGTKLIGEKSPVNGPPTGKQCIISNLDPTNHDGKCVFVISGDVYIKNIYFREVDNSAIDYDNARNLTVKNVLITRFNKGLYASPITGRHYDAILDYYVNSGINAENKNDGVTRLCRVIVKDNYSGSGLFEEVYGGANRKIYIDNCEFGNLTNANVVNGLCEDRGKLYGIFGIWLQGFEQSIVDVKIRKTFVHDFDQNPITFTQFSWGIFISPYSSTWNILIEDSTFYNISGIKNHLSAVECAQSNNMGYYVHYPGEPGYDYLGYPCCNGCPDGDCKTGPDVNPAPVVIPPLARLGAHVQILPMLEMEVEPGFVMKGSSIIRNNTFENPGELSTLILDVATIVHGMNVDLWTHTVENNVSKNILTHHASTEMGSFNLVTHIRNNKAIGGALFFSEAAASWTNFDDPGAMRVTHNITNNNWTGDSNGALAAIFIGPNGWANYYQHSQYVWTPWKELILNITNNCFDAGLAGGAAAFFSDVKGTTIPNFASVTGYLNFPTISPFDPTFRPAGEVQVNAHNNNIVGFGNSVIEVNTSDYFTAPNPELTPFNFNYDLTNNWWGAPGYIPSPQVAPFYVGGPEYNGTLVGVPGFGPVSSSAPITCPVFKNCPLVPLVTPLAPLAKLFEVPTILPENKEEFLATIAKLGKKDF